MSFLAVGAVISTAVGGAVTAATAATIVTGVVVGAVVGGAMAAIKGENILKGALIGGVVGGVTAGIASWLSPAAEAGAGAGATTGSGAAAEGGIDATAATTSTSGNMTAGLSADAADAATQGAIENYGTSELLSSGATDQIGGAATSSAFAPTTAITNPTVLSPSLMSSTAGGSGSSTGLGGLLNSDLSKSMAVKGGIDAVSGLAKGYMSGQQAEDANQFAIDARKATSINYRVPVFTFTANSTTPEAQANSYLSFRPASAPQAPIYSSQQ